MIAFLRRLWTFVRPYRTRLLMGSICGFLLAATQGMLYLVVQVGTGLIFHNDAQSSVEEQIHKAPAVIRPMLQHLIANLPATKASDVLVVTVILCIPVVMFL